MSKQISNNEFDSLDKFFSDTLKDGSLQPSDKVWQQIEGSLNEEKKGKRRFIWMFFCGLIFIGAVFLTYVFFVDTKKTDTPKTTDLTEISGDFNSKEITAKTTKGSSVQTEETKNIASKENIQTEEKISTVKIQMGAFKNQVDKNIFIKTGLNVRSERTENGITRYFAEIPENEAPQALQQIKSAGFADAFIKKNTSFTNTTNSSTSTAQASQSKKQNTLLAAKNKTVIKTNTILSLPKNNSGAQEPLASTKQPILDDLRSTNNTTDSKNESDKNMIRSNASNESQKTISGPTIMDNQVLINSIKPAELKTEVVVKTDSTLIEPSKTDSAKTVMEKKDSNLIAKVVHNDSLPPLEKVRRWALLVTGGPNFFLKNTQNNLFNTSGEAQPITYNTSLKVEYNVLKKVAISLGINYSYFIAKQDATGFYFPKNLTGDFIFYSSYGSMAVDKNTMLQSLPPLAPVTMFHANYSYTSKINSLLVPLEVKWYYLNKKKINLYTTFGTSGMFVLSEQTNLSVIKEHVTNNISYNQVNTTRFNALLMLGLGGDIRLFKQLYFTIDGGFRYGVINLSNTIGIKNNPTYFSINGGLKLRL